MVNRELREVHPGSLKSCVGRFESLDQQEVCDENVAPGSIPPASCLQVQHKNGNIDVESGLSDPLSRTLKAVATVTSMRTFWESQMHSSSKENLQPRVGTAERHAKTGNSSTISIGCLHRGLSTRDMQRDIVHMQKELEGTSEMLEQLTRRLHDVEANSLSILTSQSSNSELEEFTDAAKSEEEEEEDEELAFMRSYRESSSALWRVQRQTVRLLLMHLDKVIAERPGLKLCGQTDLDTTCASPAAGARIGSPLCSPLRRLQENSSERPCEVQRCEMQNPTLLRHLAGCRSLGPKILEEPAREPDISDVRL